MDHESQGTHESHFATYFTVFLALCGFTVLSVVADLMHMADRNVLRVIVLSIATAKALCVMLFFMHLKFERAWKYLLLVPTLILATALPFALMPDIALPYYTPEVPQRREYARMLAAEALQAGDVHPAPATTNKGNQSPASGEQPATGAD